MFRAASRYQGEQDERHEGKLHWTLHGNGIPFRGDQVPTLGPGELDRLPLVRDTKQQLFDLGKPDDAKAYSWIKQRIANGVFIQDYIEHHWDDQAKRMFIWLEWSQIYRIVPPGFTDQLNGNSSGPGSANGSHSSVRL